MDHVNLLCDIGELTAALNTEGGIGSFLQETVDMVAEHMRADVCSVYLGDRGDGSLVLRATHGLNLDGVGKVRLEAGEGLAGLALKELRPICEQRGSTHPNYRFFENLFEERFDSFLAVPILRGIERVGVLVLQREVHHPFSSRDITAMRAVANQLAATLEYARVAILSGEETTSAPPQAPGCYQGFYRGEVASVGYALGPAAVWERGRDLEALTQRAASPARGSDELAQALEETHTQLETLQRDIGERLTDVASLLFAVHLLMLKDENFAGRIQSRAAGGTNPALAIAEVAGSYIERFSRHDSLAMREKVDDIRDLTARLLTNLAQGGTHPAAHKGMVVIARELLPSDILTLAAEQAEGVVLVAGGITSHLSILARSLQIPMVIADVPELLEVPDETPVLLDAEVGNVYVEPTEEILATFHTREKARSRRSTSGKKGPGGPALTREGEAVQLCANINLLTDVAVAQDLGLWAVGLYRTEFPFIVRRTLPTEEEQYVIYRKLVENTKDAEIVFRTLDVGGDKVLSYFERHHEANPFLGMRSIRFTLQHRTVLQQQVRAILRAADGSRTGIMFPMVSSLEEFTEARELVLECARELRREGEAGTAMPKVGIMVELPAAVELAEEFAAVADFFSIGTNDLVQYLLAVDRTNEKVTYLYKPHHPAVLRAIKRVVDAARREDIPVSICGDMAHQCEYLPFLLGIGVRTLSVDPVYAPSLREAIGSLSLSHCQQTAAELLACSRTDQADAILGLQRD